MLKIIKDLSAIANILDTIDMHYNANVVKQAMVMLGDKTHRSPAGDKHAYKDLQPGTKFRFINVEYAPEAYCVKTYNGRYYVVDPYTVSKSTDANPDEEVILVTIQVIDQ